MTRGDPLRGDAGALVVTGPTGSGKSLLGLELARLGRGVVINADSMQVYRELSVLTARPGPRELSLAPHRLYGILPAAERCSAARWAAMARAEIEAAAAAGRLPVLVGGTGLYLRALMHGLAAVPDIPAEIRAAARDRLRAVGTAGLHAELARRDPEGAARLAPGDTQRLLRRWEVIEATGRPLADWQRTTPEAHGLRFHTILLLPPRRELYAACDARFLRMLERGAIDEVRALVALDLPPDLPAMKALGVPELRAHIEGTLTREAAIARAQQSTRRYAKRQITWFRHQLVGALPVETLVQEPGRAQALAERLAARFLQ